MGLAFLNKKSWHTGSFQNIEKVWIAEKKREDDDKRAAERTKKLKEERQNEELKKLQVQAGLLPASVLDRQEWIYEWGNKVQDQSKEEYLLGKPVQQQERDSKKYPFTPLLKEGFANSQNEAFVKLHEDPLFMIKQEEMKRRKEIIDNPLQMREIYKQIEGKDKPKKAKKDKKDKKDKKEKKEKKRKERKEKKSRRDSPSESRSPSRSKKRSSKRDASSSSSRSRSRDRSREKERRHHHHHSHSKDHRDHRDHKDHRDSRDHKDHKEKDVSRESTSHTTKSSLFNEYLKKKLGPNVSIDAATLKPDFGINKRKRKEHREQRDNQNHVSYEDRQKMIDEMKKNAEELTRSKLEQLKDKPEEEGKEKSGGIFITKMRNDVYGKKGDISDLGDQIARNVHYLERGGDSKNSFRK